MAAQVWVLRHGEAEPHGSRDDHERRLTPRGEHQSSCAGAALAKLALEPTVALTSPRVRALDTARLALESLGAEPVVHEPLSKGFDTQNLRDVLAEHGDDAVVLLVGHEPDLSQLVGDLTGARIDLKKGGVAAVWVQGSRGELRVLLRPRDLEALAQ
jgi:phosphohistidine phosphatase